MNDCKGCKWYSKRDGCILQKHNIECSFTPSKAWLKLVQKEIKGA